MDRTDERRAPGVARVPVSTLVEICGNDAQVPAFEAESLDVSGRGMHCRTGYVPEPGNSLVCRFEHDGSEVVVEGEVAWRRQRDEGGEFGIRFTALDVKGVDTLRRLCDLDDAAIGDEPAGRAAKPGARASHAGTRVRLHIDGLGTPMKARVREGSSRKLRVGSNLEFLKVGRHLEIEDLDQGARTGASIDSVDVVVDPQTQVPQLVVALRYDGTEDVTPEPSVVSAEPLEDEAPESPSEAVVDAGRSEDDEGEDESDEAVLRNRLGTVATHVGDAMKLAGERLAVLGRHAGAGAGRLMKDAGARVVALRAERQGRPVKRTTAPPPSGALSTDAQRLRAPKNDRVAGKPQKGKLDKRPANKRRLVLAAAAFGVVATAGGAFALRGASDDELASALAVEKAPAAAPPAHPAAAPSAKPPPHKPASDPDGVTANVPLFGPTPMATLEPAPLDPPSTEEREAIEKAAAAASVDDESWDDKSGAPKNVKPEDVEPWGRGRLHLPTIHRLRLDAKGAALQGSMHPTGFTVLVPGRKVMESGKSIARRDKRIASVSTNNVASGAQVTFKFRDGVPPYRVRLRNDFIEILISAPDPSKSH